jgi:hypothetical protein
MQSFSKIEIFHIKIICETNAALNLFSTLVELRSINIKNNENMGNKSSPPPRGVSRVTLTGLCETIHFIIRSNELFSENH